jgi:hypothetical protein
MGPPHRSHALGVGQPQIEQDNINRMPGQMPLRVTHALHVGQFDAG